MFNPLEAFDPSLPIILVVDDVEMNVMILEEILKNHYHILKANNGKQALEVLRNTRVLPKIILLDVMMPVMDGREMFEALKADDDFRHIPVIFITAENDSEREFLTAGAVDFIRKPFTPEVVELRVRNQIDLKVYRENMEQLVAEKIGEVIRKTEEAKDILDNVLQGLASVIEHRDLESGEHVKRTQLFVGALAKYLIEAKSDYASELIDMEPLIIVKSMALHDVGKIAIPDRILLKPGRLDPDEYEIMKTHTTRGMEIIKELGDVGASLYLKHCEDICYGHHERWDGKGYPRGVREGDIPITARLAAVADVYDALVCTRIYKPPMPHSQAISLMVEGKGTQFDPLLIDSLIIIQDEFQRIARQHNT
ncbi:MAG: response regulator [Treponema sp.]|jgi:putative two-component system response regulator|nr:response regulator [Treponema sp.]